MDIEMNQNILRPSICEACILRRRKRTSRRAIACFGFIAYNVLVLSVLFVTLWYITDRLHRTERTVAVLQKQNKPPEESPAIGVSSLTIKRDTEERIQINQIDDGEETVIKNVDRGLRSKRGAKRRPGKKKRCKADKKKGRQERTAPHATPHFYLSGYQRGERATNGHGIFVWNQPGGINFDGNNRYFGADINPNEGSLTKVQIKRGGVYFMFATVTANGRNNRQSNVRPAVGIYLKKNDETLDIAWKTQDSRGWRYHAISGGSEELKYPLDSMSVFGLHRLEVNDEIYIQKPPDRLNNPDDRFLTADTKARFGAFLVEGCLNCG